MGIKALPCPFCASNAFCQRLRDGVKYGAYECGECGAQGPDVRTGYGEEEDWLDRAVEAWNKRSIQIQIADEQDIDEAPRKYAERIHQLEVLLDRCRDHVSESMELMDDYDYDDAEEDAGIAQELLDDIDAALGAQGGEGV